MWKIFAIIILMTGSLLILKSFKYHYEIDYNDSYPTHQLFF